MSSGSGRPSACIRGNSSTSPLHAGCRPGARRGICWRRRGRLSRLKAKLWIPLQTDQKAVDLPEKVQRHRLLAAGLAEEEDGPERLLMDPEAAQGLIDLLGELPHLRRLPLPQPDGGELQAHQGGIVLPLAREKLLPHLLERTFGLSELAEAGQDLALDPAELQQAESIRCERLP